MQGRWLAPCVITQRHTTLICSPADKIFNRMRLRQSSSMSGRRQANKGHLQWVAALPPLPRHPVSDTIFHFIRADKWRRCGPIRRQTVRNGHALPGKHRLKSIRTALEITAIPSKPIKQPIKEFTASATHFVSTEELRKIEKRFGTGEQSAAYKRD